MEWEQTAFFASAIVVLLLIYCVWLKRKLKVLEKMAKSEFEALSTVHDLKNILAGIIGAAEILNREIVEESLRRYAKIILHSCHKFSSVLSGLQKASSDHEDFSLVDLTSCLDEASEILGCSVSDRILLKKDYPTEECTVYGNPAEIANVILNLGLNAADAMNGAGTVEIVLQTRYLSDEALSSCLIEACSGNYAEILVRDYGCGISKYHQKQIFTPFYSEKKYMSGSGLGLSNVKRIVEAHHGTLKVESSGAGTSFFVYLPLVPEKHIESAENESHPVLNAKVLLVDDDRILGQLTSDMLEKCGADVEVAFSAEQALGVYSLDFDIVLLDILLPEKNGTEVLQELRRINPEVKVLLMSGRSLTAEEKQFVMNDPKISFIRKPCSQRECCLKISNMLAK